MDFIYGAKTMAMPQRDDTIEAIKRLDALLEYAVMENCGDRPRESLIFQGFPDVGQAATPCLDILCRLSARW